MPKTYTLISFTVTISNFYSATVMDNDGITYYLNSTLQNNGADPGLASVSMEGQQILYLYLLKNGNLTSAIYFIDNNNNKIVLGSNESVMNDLLYNVPYYNATFPNFPGTLVDIASNNCGLVTDANGNFSNIVCCLHPETLVDTKDGYKPIKNVIKGDIVKDLKGNYIETINNIKFQTTNKFIKLEKDGLAPNIPDQDILATEGHPISFNNKELTFKELGELGLATNVYQDYVPVYSLITKERTCVMMNNLPVYTWNLEDWEKFVEDTGISHILQ